LATNVTTVAKKKVRDGQKKNDSTGETTEEGYYRRLI